MKHPYTWSFCTQRMSCDACGKPRERVRIEPTPDCRDYVFLCDDHPLSHHVRHPVTADAAARLEAK